LLFILLSTKSGNIFICSRIYCVYCILIATSKVLVTGMQHLHGQGALPHEGGFFLDEVWHEILFVLKYETKHITIMCCFTSAFTSSECYKFMITFILI